MTDNFKNTEELQEKIYREFQIMIAIFLNDN